MKCVLTGNYISDDPQPMRGKYRAKESSGGGVTKHSKHCFCKQLFCPSYSCLFFFFTAKSAHTDTFYHKHLACIILTRNTVSRESSCLTRDHTLFALSVLTCVWLCEMWFVDKTELSAILLIKCCVMFDPLSLIHHVKCTQQQLNGTRDNRQCEMNSDPMTLKIMQCVLGIRWTPKLISDIDHLNLTMSTKGKISQLFIIISIMSLTPTADQINTESTFLCA